MPTYTLEQLQALSQSTLVATPEFKWNDWASVFRGRRRSSVANRPIIEQQRQKTVEFDEEELENDPDKAMAAFFLRKNPGATASQQKEGTPPAAAVAPAADSAIEEVEDGWTSVNTKQKKRGMSRGSFSKWK